MCNEKRGKNHVTRFFVEYTKNSNYYKVLFGQRCCMEVLNVLMLFAVWQQGWRSEGEQEGDSCPRQTAGNGQEGAEKVR